MKWFHAFFTVVLILFSCVMFGQGLNLDKLQNQVPIGADFVAVLTPEFLTKSPVGNYLQTHLNLPIGKTIGPLFSELKCKNPVYILGNIKQNNAVAVLSLDQSMDSLYIVMQYAKAIAPKSFSNLKFKNKKELLFVCDNKLISIVERKEGLFLLGEQKHVFAFQNATKSVNSPLLSQIPKRLMRSTFCLITNADILKNTKRIFVYEVLYEKEPYLAFLMETAPLKNVQAKKNQYVMMLKMLVMSVLDPDQIEHCLKCIKLSVKKQESTFLFKLDPVIFKLFKRGIETLNHAKLN